MNDEIVPYGSTRPVYVMRLKHAVPKAVGDELHRLWCAAWLQSGHLTPPGLLILDPSITLTACRG